MKITPIYHEEEHGGCGGIGFLWKGEIIIGMTLNAENVLKINGEQAFGGEEAICGNCGGRMKPIFTVRSEYRDD